MVLRILKAAVLVALALSMAASSAHAGQFHLYTCRTPNGESAPADGWSGSKTGQAADDYTGNTCTDGGALIASLGDKATHLAGTDRATWQFEPLSTELLTGATIWRAGDTAGGFEPDSATYAFWLSASTETNVFEKCMASLQCGGLGMTGIPTAPVNRVVLPEPSAGSSIYLNAACLGVSEPEPYACGSGTGDSNGYSAVVYLYAADLTLEQTAGPSAGNVSGELASGADVSGTSDVAFSATDPGAGVYEALFSVDGQVVQSTVINDNGGRCKNVGQTSDGLPAFLYLQPCLASVNADIGLDTTKVSNGVHHLVVSVVDAAGNSSPVLDRSITVANPVQPGAPGPANGTNASAQATLTASWKGSRGERLTSGYGRGRTIDGRLTAPGAVPIVGAQIDVLVTPGYTGARTVRMASPRTRQDGRFSIALPRGASSLTLRLAYRSHVGDAVAAATRTLALRVKAGIALSIAPRTASVGRSIFFRGRLLGGPIPRGGKQLVLEARSPGGPWIEFDVVRSDRRGRYHASYRFKFAGPADYQFRVRSEAESDYPFAAGASNAVGVYER
jgi:hypothetical protein